MRRRNEGRWRQLLLVMHWLMHQNQKSWIMAIGFLQAKQILKMCIPRCVVHLCHIQQAVHLASRAQVGTKAAAVMTRKALRVSFQMQILAWSNPEVSLPLVLVALGKAAVMGVGIYLDYDRSGLSLKQGKPVIARGMAAT